MELQRFLVEGRIEAGCDEAGRGPLVGPVTAAAVILPPRFSQRHYQRQQATPRAEAQSAAPRD